MLEREVDNSVWIDREISMFGRWVTMRADLERKIQGEIYNPNSSRAVIAGLEIGASTLDHFLSKHPARVREFGTEIEGQVHVGLRILTDVIEDIRGGDL